MPTRKDMIDALREILMPVLRKRGFTGSFPHLRRINSDRVDLLTVQFDKWGGGFVVEIARNSTDGFTTHWGEKIAPQKLKAHDLHPNQRLRLGTNRPSVDHWFRYDRGKNVKTVAQEALSCLDQAETWWNRNDREKTG